jgi:hypothetical protein
VRRSCDFIENGTGKDAASAVRRRERQKSVSELLCRTWKASFKKNRHDLSFFVDCRSPAHLQLTQRSSTRPEGTMKIVFRIMLLVSFLLCCGGVLLIGWGNEEGKLAAKATAEPIAADLAKLEAGEQPSSIHLALGEHYAFYGERAIYKYTEDKNSKIVVGPETKVDYAFYPIVSKGNPDLKNLDALKAKHGSLDQIPEEELPLPTHFTVLVKTTRFKKEGDIPADTVKQEPSVQGLVINEVSSLDSIEKNLILQEFPTIDFKKVLILEQGRKPHSTATATAASLAGWVILGLSVIAFIGTAITGVMALFQRNK